MLNIMQREQTLIPVDMDQEDVALRFQKYALVSAAVVDGSGRLVGMITVDDVVHIIQEEASEDALLLSGVDEVHRGDRAARRRAGERGERVELTLGRRVEDRERPELREAARIVDRVLAGRGWSCHGRTDPSPDGPRST